ncbi:MAG TPA: hypothetical protein ACQGQH_09910 [Xylella sp.]
MKPKDFLMGEFALGRCHMPLMPLPVSGDVFNSTGKVKKLVEGREGIGTKDAIHVVGHLHDFIHNLSAVPEQQEVKMMWEK